MTVAPLTINEAVTRDGANYVVTLDYSDISAAATSKTVNVLADDGVNLPAGTTVELKSVDVVTAFTGGSVTAITMKVGDGDNTARFAADTSIAAAGPFSAIALTGDKYRYTSADTVDATFTATGGNLDALSAGKVNLYFQVVLP